MMINSINTAFKMLYYQMQSIKNKQSIKINDNKEKKS